MQCPKCKTENPERVTYCVRCHAPLRYTCPACRNVQLQGGKCEKCGVDFAKYAAMLVFRAQETAKHDRSKAQDRSAMLKQLLLLPITGGLSLIKFLLARVKND